MRSLAGVANVAVAPVAPADGTASNRDRHVGGIVPDDGRIAVFGRRAASGAWSAVVETGPGNGIPSPNGDLSVQFDRDQVCFLPVDGERRCGPLAAGATPTFAAFSQDGADLLIVAGPPPQRVSTSFTPRTGPHGCSVQPASRTSRPVRARRPGICPARSRWPLGAAGAGHEGGVRPGIAVRPDLGVGDRTPPFGRRADQQFAEPVDDPDGARHRAQFRRGAERIVVVRFRYRGSTNQLAIAPEPGGTIVLSRADPLGRFVLICPRHADGVLGTLIRVAVDQSRNVQILPDARSCAGSVYSPDGAHVAVTTEVDGVYSLVVIGVQDRGSELTVPLSVSTPSTPSTPPYLTWNGDVIVVDASVWVRSLVDDGPMGDATRRVLTDHLRWIAPAHAPIEALRTVRRYEVAGLLTTAQAQSVAEEVLAAEVDCVGPERWLLTSVWRDRHNVSACDAPYVAIAQHRGIPLVTLDQRLARAASAAAVQVIVPVD